MDAVGKRFLLAVVHAGLHFEGMLSGVVHVVGEVLGAAGSGMLKNAAPQVSVATTDVHDLASPVKGVRADAARRNHSPNEPWL